MKQYNKIAGAILLVFVLLSAGLRAQVISTFTTVYQTTQKGGIVYLANTALGCSANPPLVALSATCAAGSTVVPPAGTLQDNNFTAAFIDIDGDPSTFMSSSDSLALPPCSQLTKAYLFWGASGATTPSLTTCKLKVNNGSYQTVTAAASQTNSVGFDTYHCYADVTALLQTGGINSRITVANINSNAIGVANKFGSWCIAVVYKNDLKTMRQLTIFKGLANVSGAATIVNVPISGFLTPLSGPVSLEVGLYVHDGDRALTGDNLNFKGAAAFLPLTDAVNGLNDVMNSTVSYSGALTPYRLPNLSNTAGLDADIYVPNNSLKTFIGNSATSATFQMTTGGETYLPQMVTTAIDVYEPDLRASIKAKDVNGGLLLPGDIVEYTIKGVNIGSDPSNNTFITDTIDVRADYIPNSTKIIFGPGLGSMTDVAGDDRVDYSAASRTLKIRIGSGATAALGGTVINSPAGIDSTIITYSVMCTASCIKIACSPSINAQAYIWGTGATSSNTYNNGSNPGIFDAFGCPIPGTTSSPITATTCGVPLASNNGPGCTGSTVLLSAPTDTGVTYSWSGPNSFTSSVQNPTLASLALADAGLYTVTLSVPGNSCNAVLSTSVTIGVCTPTAVNDATNTIANTPVSGNAASNDLNLISPVFSISAQPANGTLTMASNGQYTFTPTPSFTGVTTATYAVCNSTFCSSATISFTVLPTLIANPDNLLTTPTSTVGGNLLGNDAGATPTLGSTFSVSLTQPSASTGTFALDPTTGQYTFTPNPAFAGSVQTTYTVCNTAVNPQVCSSSSITIQVYPNPVPVNDGTATVIGTPVSGNAAANDTGTASATFSIVNAPASGTMQINTTTGQYTYTPTPTFTGVVTSTYQVCNGAATTCSTAVISVSVYPAIATASDVITTTPTLAVTGSLTANDSGITSAMGATYSVTATQLPAGTGTISVNPATGQYTFTPNPAFTGTAATTYTLCNISAGLSQCSTNTILVNVFAQPQPVNDATTTIVNVPVVANASTNDAGTIGATYSITTQPTNGTITINASTGQYTFTPAPSFTGVTTATYQLCNAALGTCSTAAINVTVHPLIVANPDNITTTPTVAATGTLLGNDAGITSTLGATYSVSVTQPLSTTGTFVINPSTGQYTFTPNPAFAGTTQTTYTVCNTAVNAPQCSTSTITLNVYPVPVPVNDNTTTVANTTVSGNARANDTGTNAAVYSMQTQGTGGTVSINPTTGVYTYTPAPGFTGVNTATYQMCNGALTTCSTAVITITVYPTLSANSDTVIALPNTGVSGTLATNDGGVVFTGSLAATYNYTVSAINPTIGVITVTPATGQYSFTPATGFTGSTTTTYTVCNTAVNPQVCSTTTVFIIVGALPTAVADANQTSINTPVSGTVATNDGGALPALNPVFTASQPLAGTGTLTMNSSTGAYTFTPASGFTGTTSATYTLCNISSPPCSTTTITFSVYPALLANPDVVNTATGTAVSGTLLGNDAGVVTSGTLTATYSVSITQPAASTGTFVINPATGQYTFTPNPAFTGSAQTTYTVCNTTVTPQVCSSTSITINVLPNPAPVNDFSTTVANASITANAGTNDGGKTGGTFTVINQSTGGTLTINSTSGQYTFVPTTNFTGVYTATYNLCNGAPVTCSAAVITITVYPTLLASNDVVNTAPATAATGTLLGNDAGVIAGGNYSVTATPLPAGTGTLVVNPTTGQYTFTPNPAFTGSAATTYTVCNNSVNPIVCSQATITLNVLPNPAPVNDNTTTVINTSVVANASTNDGGTVGGTYSIVAQGIGGTVTINPSTGQYTFVPTPTFTGVTTATYNLCNGAPTTCSTAVITITVYPALTATTDVISTGPGAITTGSLLSNDGGILPGGNYSVTATPLPAGTGTLVVNPTTGQYTFTPNPAFTGTAVTTYTVCNNSVNPIVCSTASIAINVLPNPAPVNDGTTTVINTTVTGNASTNDGGTVGGTYSIVAQGTGGTVTINPSTGQYTFVPTPTFTGVTTATYNLCNGVPNTCSTAVISITVYPALTATTDVVSTGPGASTTGSLLSNDGGILPGGNYSVTATPLPAGTGTLVVNPTTGQYTFTPNSAFTGTAVTTYTVCNNSVNPIICSTASIAINVLPNPAPVNDGTTTVINTTVTGNASTNDGGTIGGTYSIVAQGTGGTVTINPSTGQYTFVPTPTFTGVTTATYNLCNGVPNTCSTAVISITVYPNLLAVNDVINTGPGITANGNLLGNDAGILAGGNYSVSVGALPTSTGTLSVNPATGQYTFIPAPGFTGSASTTYTVCNNSVTPTICSTATITLNVLPNPAPVDDATITLVGSPVSGNLSSNDGGTSGGTYSIVGQPTGGTVTVNPSTGQYTFTPSPTFTGVTTATYVLCNGAPVTCSTAILTITVYPNLLAVNDVTTTGLNTPVSGGLAVNDNGIVSGGVYGFTATPTPTTSGTLTVNPSTGQYTFVPATGFTGTVVTTYTVCQYNGTVTLQCSTATISINVGPRSAIGIAKRIVSTTYNSGSTADIRYKLTVKNLGNQPLQGVEVSDDLNAAMPSPVTFTVVEQPVIVNAAASALVAKTDFDGKQNTKLTASSSSLAVGKTDTIYFTVRISGNGYSGLLQNIAAVSAAGSGTTVTDTSVDGDNPDPDNDGNGNNNGGASTFTCDVVKIGIAKSASASQSLGGGCYQVQFKFTVKNYGTGSIYRVSVLDNLAQTFANANSYSVVGTPTCVNNHLVPNTAFTGSGANTNLVTSSSSLAAGAVDTVLVKVDYCVTGAMQFSNTAVAEGFSLPTGGFSGSDNSSNGNNPDPNGNGTPDESSPCEFAPNPEIFIPEGFSPNNDGVNDLFVTRGLNDYPENEVSILNRWGNVVYRKKQYDNSWDGTSNQGVTFGSNQLPEGTYFYIIDLGGGKKPLKGYIYLNRNTK